MRFLYVVSTIVVIVVAAFHVILIACAIVVIEVHVTLLVIVVIIAISVIIAFLTSMIAIIVDCVLYEYVYWSDCQLHMMIPICNLIVWKYLPRKLNMETFTI